MSPADGEHRDSLAPRTGEDDLDRVLAQVESAGRVVERFHGLVLRLEHKIDDVARGLDKLGEDHAARAEGAKEWRQVMVGAARKALELIGAAATAYLAFRFGSG